MDAILPRLVAHDELPGASALMSLRSQAAVIAGPSIGGIIIASSSVGVGYGVDVFTYIVSLAFLNASAFRRPFRQVRKAISGSTL